MIAPRLSHRSRAVVVSALVVALLGVVGVRLAPAHAAPTPADLVLAGHGNGHRRGMGQYGALGYSVDYGWSTAQILDHYYGGTTAGTVDGGQPVTVRIAGHDNRTVAFQVDQGALATYATGWVPEANDKAVRIQTVSNGFQISDAPSCNGPWSAPRFHDWSILQIRPVSAPGSQTLIDANDVSLAQTPQLCNAGTNGGWSDTAADTRYYRGESRVIRHTAGDGFPAGTCDTSCVVNVVAIDGYVRGVVPRESPASWGDMACSAAAGGAAKCGQHALEAQAVAARSYAWAENRAPLAQTCDTTSCQVYLGRAKRVNGGAIQSLEAPESDAAVAATPGQVRKLSNGSVARTEFSSSTGGWTAGGTFPSVVDDGDATASNPYHSWTQTVPAADLAQHFGKGAFISAKITSRSSVDNRAVTGIDLTFADGTVSQTGDDLRSAFGLKSTWFSVIDGRIDRIGGTDRYDTSRLVAAALGQAIDSGSGCPVSRRAIVVSGTNFPDALSASYLAGVLGAPILLVGQTTLPDPVRAAIGALGISQVTAVGGTSAIGQGVLDAIDSLPLTVCGGGAAQGTVDVSRVAGADRFETARLVALAGGRQAGTLSSSLTSCGSPVRTAILVSGDNFPDGLAAGSLASHGAVGDCGSGPIPLLLTSGGSLSPAAASALSDPALGIQRVVVVGGTSTVNDSVLSAADAISNIASVQRVAGPTRQDTAVEVAKLLRASAGVGFTRVLIARGEAFPDALAAGPLAGQLGAPILLTAGTNALGAPAANYLTAQTAIQQVTLLGGTGALTPDVEADVSDALAAR